MRSYKPCAYKPSIRKSMSDDRWVAIYWNGTQWITKPVKQWRTALFLVHINARYEVMV